MNNCLYNVKIGTVNACKNDFSLPGGSLEVDPLSPTVNHGWQLRNLPAMKWTAKSSDYFTLVLYDIGFTYLHALYVNIPGSNITNADVSWFYLYFYHGSSFLF